LRITKHGAHDLQTFASLDNVLHGPVGIRQSDRNEPEKGASRDAAHVSSARLVLPGMI
jgi:hypothetical protein